MKIYPALSGTARPDSVRPGLARLGQEGLGWARQDSARRCKSRELCPEEKGTTRRVCAGPGSVGFRKAGISKARQGTHEH